MVLIAENLTATNAEIARAVRERDPDPIARVAAAARDAGAEWLDVNLGRGRGGGPDALQYVLEVLGEVWSRGVVVDSTSAEVMARACEVWRGPVALNGFSGDVGREGILDVAARHGTELVVFLMAGGIPRSADDRLALAAELVGRCMARGVAADRLWIDPVVAPLGWTQGQEYDAALLEVVRRLPELFGERVQTVVGLSNLTTGATPGQRLPWLQEVFLAAAAGAGLTHALLDVRNPRLVRVARALAVLTGQRVFAPQELVDPP